MDVSKYKDLFISEALEILSNLSKNLIELEKSPHSKDLLNEIFREAHTIKGMSASMGYENISKITHEMESTLDMLRQGKVEANKQTVNLLFECLDIIELLVSQVKESKPSGDPGETERLDNVISNLKKVKEELPSGKKGLQAKLNLALANEDMTAIAKAFKDGFKAYKLAVSLDKNCQLKEARAYVVMSVLEEWGTVIKPQMVKQQFNGASFGRYFGIFFITKQEISLIETEVKKIQDVEQIAFSRLQSSELNFNKKSPVKKPEEKIITNQVNAKEAPMVKVSLDKLDKLMNIVGELVINKTRLLNTSAALGDGRFNEVLKQTQRLTDDLQIETMGLRLVPMDYVFNRFPRLVRDLANKQDKNIKFIIEGAQIGLDRSILDEINEPLVHLLRNAVDHGIESKEQRVKAEKSVEATIKLCAKRERDHIVIEVSDDGKGINASEIKALAIEKNLINSKENNELNNDDILRFISLPGFSTNKKVTEASGRGVGMNSVKTKVESFGGALKMSSTFGKGSTFTLKLPLSMAIFQALLVKVANETYAIPLINISETIKVKEENIKKVEHHQMINYKDQLLNIVSLREKLGFNQSENEKTDSNYILVVVVEAGHRKIGLIVDRFLGKQEVVIKTLKKSLKNLKGIAGATILGDGKVALIVDVPSL